MCPGQQRPDSMGVQTYLHFDFVMGRGKPKNYLAVFEVFAIIACVFLQFPFYTVAHLMCYKEWKGPVDAHFCDSFLSGLMNCFCTRGAFQLHKSISNSEQVRNCACICICIIHKQSYSFCTYQHIEKYNMCKFCPPHVCPTARAATIGTHGTRRS